MTIVRAIACLTPFPAEFITIIPVGLRPPGGPGGQKIAILWMVRDALGGIRGSSMSIFTGFSKDFEKFKIRKLKIGRNRFKMGYRYV